MKWHDAIVWAALSGWWTLCLAFLIETAKGKKS